MWAPIKSKEQIVVLQYGATKAAFAILYSLEVFVKDIVFNLFGWNLCKIKLLINTLHKQCLYQLLLCHL